MEHILHTTLFQDGEYDAVLREIEARPMIRKGGMLSCYIKLHFEILDGPPGPEVRENCLTYDEFWDADGHHEDTLIDRLADMVQPPGRSWPGQFLRSAGVGQCFRVRVSIAYQVNDAQSVSYYTAVDGVLGITTSFQDAFARRPVLMTPASYWAMREHDLRLSEDAC